MNKKQSNAILDRREVRDKMEFLLHAVFYAACIFGGIVVGTTVGFIFLLLPEN